jgi:hypothetical protein
MYYNKITYIVYDAEVRRNNQILVEKIMHIFSVSPESKNIN